MKIPGILHLVDTLDPGGAEQVAVNLVNHLSRERFRPFLATTRREGPLAAGVRSDVGRLALNRTSTLDPGALRRFLAFVRENDVAILHAHASALFFAQLAAFFAPHLKVVWHDHFGRYLEENRPAWLWGPPARRAAAVVAVNEDLARWSRETLGAGPVVYLPNFVPDAPDTPVPDLPGEPGVLGGRVVCVANLRAQKDHPNLLQAFARVLRDEPGARLLLAGAEVEADYAARVKQMASALGDGGDRVVFLGSRSDVPALLRGCDVGVLASASEGFPLSLLEYGRAGLAAVATRVGQCAEVLEDGEAGVLVPPADPGALAREILALLRDPGRRSALGERLACRVRERYSPGAVMERLEAVYYKALNSEKP
ncbi:MAG TPA: glycosyltransferase [Thermoanaerobaculia bacterium]|nr:glycosyltransferase [Thermoanaerobaculia bacterium]